MNRMELRQLEYFAAVARSGGFTRAAEQLHVAQPAVSAQIRSLERELGVELFARTTRSVALTAAGTSFLAQVERVLGELGTARRELDELTAILRGRLTIGATLVLGGLDLPNALATFTGRYPGVTLTLRTGLVAHLLDELDAGELDLVLGPVHPGLPRRYLARTLAREDVVLVTAPGHRLAGRAQPLLSELRDEPFVCLSADSGLRALLDGAARRAGFRPHVRFETHSPASIRELVSAGLGVALLARSAADAPGPPIAVHPVRPPVRHPPIAAIRRRDRPPGPSAQAFLQHVQRPK